MTLNGAKSNCLSLTPAPSEGHGNVSHAKTHGIVMEKMRDVSLWLTISPR